MNYLESYSFIYLDKLFRVSMHTINNVLNIQCVLDKHFLFYFLSPNTYDDVEQALHRALINFTFE